MQAIPTSVLLPQSDFSQTEFYNDWIRPQEDIWGGGGMVLLSEPGRSLVFGGNIRAKDRDIVEPKYLDLMNRLGPVVLQAFEVSRRLSGLTLQNFLLRCGVEVDNAAVLVLDRNRRILFANAFAQSLISDGTLRHDAMSRLATLSDATAERALSTGLQMLFARGLGSPPFAMAPGSVVRLYPLDTSVTPFAPFGPLQRDPGTVAVLLIDRSQAVDGLQERLMQGFGLSAAEAAIAMALAEGGTLREIAASRGRSVNTLRNQVQTILDKTASHRQANLVRLIERLRRGS